MMIFPQLDQYLKEEFSADYWSDYAVLYAIELVQKMTPTDWNQLKSCWRDRAPLWQYRSAEIIADGDSRQAIPLLLEMLETADDELTLTAVDSLRSMGIADKNLELSQDIFTRLHKIAPNNPIAQIVVNELLKALPIMTF